MKQRRNRLRRRPSVGSSVVVACRSPPDLWVEQGGGETVRSPQTTSEEEAEQTCGIKQAEGVRLPSDHHRDCIVVKHLEENIHLTAAVVSRYFSPTNVLTVGTYSEGNLLVV